MHAASNVPGLCGFACPCEPLVCGFSSPPHAFSQRPAPCPPHWRTDPASRRLPKSPWAPGKAEVLYAFTVPGGVWSDGCVVFVSLGKIRQALKTFLIRREPPPRKRRGPRMLTKSTDWQSDEKACKQGNFASGKICRRRRLDLTIPKGSANPPQGSCTCIQGSLHGRK